ncbi:MAG: hypothetical protein IJB65_04495, partial [Clostridia bacterium]|nr:hypothetical protein [Clostridia bacterium]
MVPDALGVLNNIQRPARKPITCGRVQTADKGTEHEKRKYSYYKVKNFGENFPEIFIYFYIFSLKTNLGSQY